MEMPSFDFDTLLQMWMHRRVYTLKAWLKIVRLWLFISELDILIVKILTGFSDLRSSYKKSFVNVNFLLLYHICFFLSATVFRLFAFVMKPNQKEKNFLNLCVFSFINPINIVWFCDGLYRKFLNIFLEMMLRKPQFYLHAPLSYLTQ